MRFDYDIFKKYYNLATRNGLNIRSRECDAINDFVYSFEQELKEYSKRVKEDGSDDEPNLMQFAQLHFYFPNLLFHNGCIKAISKAIKHNPKSKEFLGENIKLGLLYKGAEYVSKFKTVEFCKKILALARRKKGIDMNLT